MSFGVGGKVEVITLLFLTRWVRPLEKGEVVGRRVSPAGQELYGVELETGEVFTLAPSEIEEVENDIC